MNFNDKTPVTPCLTCPAISVGCGGEAELDDLPVDISVVDQHQSLGGLLNSVEICESHPALVLPTPVPLLLALHELHLVRRGGALLTEHQLNVPLSHLAWHPVEVNYFSRS